LWLIYHVIVFSIFTRGHRGRDRMVVGFTTTYAISACHHLFCSNLDQGEVYINKWRRWSIISFNVFGAVLIFTELFFLLICITNNRYEKFEETKRIIRSVNRRMTMAKWKRTKGQKSWSDLQNTIQEAND
jgi:hypothetical protein